MLTSWRRWKFVDVTSPPIVGVMIPTIMIMGISHILLEPKKKFSYNMTKYISNCNIYRERMFLILICVNVDRCVDLSCGVTDKG